MCLLTHFCAGAVFARGHLLQRVAMKLDDGASFDDESVLGRPQGEDHSRCRVRYVKGPGRSHFRSRRYLDG